MQATAPIVAVLPDSFSAVERVDRAQSLVVIGFLRR